MGRKEGGSGGKEEATSTTGRTFYFFFLPLSFLSFLLLLFLFNVDLGDEGFFYYHGQQSSTLRAYDFYE